MLYEAVLGITEEDPRQSSSRRLALMNRAAAFRDLGLVEKARDELQKLLPELDRLPADESLSKGRARYHLADCEWRLGDRQAAGKLAEASLTAYDAAPKEKPVDAALRKQSEDLLADLKAGKTPSPLPKFDADAAIEAARARYRAIEAFTKVPLDQKASPLLDQMLGPAAETKQVLATLDAGYRKANKPPVWFLPIDKPIAPELETLLGPEKKTKEVLDALDAQYRKENRPPVWFLPIDQPISPHLDELLEKPSK